MNLAFTLMPFAGESVYSTGSIGSTTGSIYYG